MHLRPRTRNRCSTSNNAGASTRACPPTTTLRSHRSNRINDRQHLCAQQHRSIRSIRRFQQATRHTRNRPPKLRTDPVTRSPESRSWQQPQQLHINSGSSSLTWSGIWQALGAWCIEGRGLNELMDGAAEGHARRFPDRAEIPRPEHPVFQRWPGAVHAAHGNDGLTGACRTSPGHACRRGGGRGAN